MNIRRQNILGVEVSAINMEIALLQLTGWINGQQSSYVCVTPAHSIMDCYADPAIRRIFNASGMITPDGMAVVWLLKLYGHRMVSRVYGPDLLLAACQHGLERGWKHYFYGGAEGIAQTLADQLKSRLPDLLVAGFESPPFRPLTTEEKTETAERITASGADFVWVGLGSPKQERWMAEFHPLLERQVLIGVGAAFDFLSGNKAQAPHWVQRSGLEWFYRLLQEPGRLWKRYIQYPKFVVLVLGQFLGLFKFNSKGQN